MTQTQPTPEDQINRVLIVIGVVLFALAILFIGLAVFLALNAGTTGPSVEVVRDYLIILMALEMVIIGAAIVVFLIQLARFINLLNNEIKPLVDTTSETLNIVKGTAAFMSKYLADPVIKANAQASAVASVLKDVDAIRKAVSNNGSETDGKKK